MRHLPDVDATLAAIDALEPPPGSWVATDADGTLWAADVADVGYRAVVAARGVRPAAGDYFARSLARVGVEPSGDPTTDAARLYELYPGPLVDDRVMLEAMVFCFAGWSIRELRPFARAVLSRELLPRVYDTTGPLLSGLLARGLRLAVISGSAELLVEEAVGLLELPGPVKVLGVRARLEDEALSTTLESPVTWEQGKLDAIRPHLDGVPLQAAFGDTYGDYALLQAARLRVLVHPRPQLREQARREGGLWCELSPTRTTGGHHVRAPTTDQTLDPGR